MSRRDRQGVRTPAGLEQKYNFGVKFSNQNTTNMTTAERIVFLDRTMSENKKNTDSEVGVLKNEDASIKQSVDTLRAETASTVEAINQNIGTIEQSIELINTTITTLDGEKVNKADVVNNLTTTAEGKVADARTVKALYDRFKIVRQVYSVNLTSNSYCKPFSYFGSYDISAAIRAYGFPVGVYLYTSASVPMACYFSDGVVRMASGEASNTLVVDYLNGGYQ